jgi:phosphatidate cytidylyltransferase
MLSTRILTALVGIPIVFLCIYYGKLLFSIMMFVIIFFCVKEFINILKKYNPHKTVVLIVAAATFIFLNLENFYWSWNWIFHDVWISFFYRTAAVLYVIAILCILFALEIFNKTVEGCMARISVSFLGALFLPIALNFMIHIRNMENGRAFIFIIFITVWILDTAAYAFGKMYGRHKLAANVSPKKTVEGAIAGIVFGILTALVLGAWQFKVWNIWESVFFGLIIAIVAQFSDLAESLIKRDANIKDSGTIIPGHGGFLDRFDSYIFAAPVFYCLLSLKSLFLGV